MNKTWLILFLNIFFLFGFLNSNAKWQQLEGPYGGYCTCISSDGSNIFAGTKGGLFRTTNNGSNWTRINNGLTNTYISSILIDNNTIYAGTQGGLFISTNNGSSWSRIGNDNGLFGHRIRAIAKTNSNIFVGTNIGVFISTDNGNNWAIINNGLINTSISSLVISGTKIFAGTYGGGVYSSSDNGNNWAASNNGLTSQYVNTLAANGNKIYAGTSGSGIFISENYGNNWVPVNNGLNGSVVNSITINGTSVFAGTNGGVFNSSDGGNSWIESNNGLTNKYVNTLTKSNNNIFIGTSGGGIFLSTDNGNSWEAINSGFLGHDIISLAVRGTKIIAGSNWNGGVFLSDNNGINWESKGLSGPDFLEFKDNYIFAENSGWFYRSSDNGNNWESFRVGLNSSGSFLYIHGQEIYAVTSDGVSKSTDNGSTWTVKSTFSTQFNFSMTRNGHDLFLGTNKGVYLSIDDGQSWVHVLKLESWVNSMVVAGGNIFAGTLDKGIFLSTDGGYKWTSVNTGLTSYYIASMVTDGANIFAGTSDGVFLSNNNGEKWTNVSSDLTVSLVDEIKIDGEYIFAGTAAGVWKRPLSEMISLPILHPKIILNTSVINTGQNITVYGKDFKPNGTITITINGFEGFSMSENSIDTDSQGGFIYNFTTTSEMQPGIYSVNASDNITRLTSALVQFYLKSSTDPTSNLKISSPLKAISIESDEKLLVEWKDLMVQGQNYPIIGSKRNYKYLIELSADNGSTWENLETIEGQAYIDSRIDLNYSVSIEMPGNDYVIRITDLYNPLNTQRTPPISLKQKTQPNNVKMMLDWDFSWPKPSVPVEGVAAEGTARIYLKLNKINSTVGPGISSVKISLKDQFNGSDPALLGKVKVANQTSEYSSEANDLKAITAIDNTAGKSSYIFWYVAPDDFTGGDPADLNSSYRFVTADLTVNYQDGTTEKVSKQIRIVRPPLMLVHGLAGEARSWDHFKHNGIGYELKFIDDYRFNTRIAINMLPDASFKTNALELTLGYANPSINTFQGVINDLRNKGFAVNQVDYIGHSMGGSVLRSIYDNYYDYFTRTGNAVNRPFKNYEKGYVNKAILIGTPHNSSPLADIVNRYVGDLSYLARTTVQSWYGFSGIDKKPIPLMFIQPEDINAFLWTYKATDAVRDLQIDNTQGGVNFGVTNARAHLISGDFFPGTQYNTNGIIPQEIINIVKNTGGEEFQNMFNWFLKIAYKKEPDPILKQQMLNILESKVDPLEKALAFFDKMAIVLDAFNIGTFLPESDFVVSVGSQLAGYQKPTINGDSNVSVFDDFVGHAYFRAELRNLDIGNRVNYLLNRPINSTSFNSIPATSEKKAKLKIKKSILSDDIISKSDSTKLQLLLPENNSSAIVDSSFQVQFAIKDTTNLKSIELRFQNKTYYLDSIFLGTISMDLQVTSILLDSQKIVLEGFYLDADSALFVYDMININVVTKDTLTDFGVNPNILFLYSNQIKQPEYYATYNNSVATGNFSQHISAVVNDTSIVRFDYRLKSFKGINPGETYATVSYKDISDTLYFVVYEMEIDPTIVGINETEILVKNRNTQNVIIYPNPFQVYTTLEVKETKLQTNGYWILRVFDLMGNLVIKRQFETDTYILNRGELISGMYIYSVTGRTGIIGSGKLVIID